MAALHIFVFSKDFQVFFTQPHLSGAQEKWSQNCYKQIIKINHIQYFDLFLFQLRKTWQISSPSFQRGSLVPFCFPPALYLQKCCFVFPQQMRILRAGAQNKMALFITKWNTSGCTPFLTKLFRFQRYKKTHFCFKNKTKPKWLLKVKEQVCTITTHSTVLHPSLTCYN